MEHVPFGAQEIKLGDSEDRTRDVVTAESRLKRTRRRTGEPNCREIVFQKKLQSLNFNRI